MARPMTDRNKTNDPHAAPEPARPVAARAPAPTDSNAVVSTAAGSIGDRLCTARTALGLSPLDCARRLHLPVAVLQRLEAGDFGSPEDFVFVRGALIGYAKFLGIPRNHCEEALRAVAPPAPPALVSVARTSHTRWLLQRYGTAATYIVLTATIAVPLVWLGLRGGLQRPVTRIVSLDQPGVSTPAQAATAAEPPVATVPAPPDAAPFRAAMTPFAEMGFSDLGTASTSSITVTNPVSPLAAPASAPASAPAAGEHALTIAATADCWFEITNADGTRIASGMLHAGDSRTWHAAGMLHVTLGNVAGVSVVRDGEPLELNALAKNNVARFDVFGPAPASEND